MSTNSAHPGILLSLSLFLSTACIARADPTGVCPAVSSANQLSRIACEASPAEEGERRGRVRGAEREAASRC